MTGPEPPAETITAPFNFLFLKYPLGEGDGFPETIDVGGEAPPSPEEEGASPDDETRDLRACKALRF